MENTCKFCGTVFNYKYKSLSHRKFCCYQCKADSQKGKPPWNKGMAGLMPPAWNKGMKGRQPWHNTSGLRPPVKGKKVPALAESNNPNWKGDNVGYSGVHHWMTRHHGKPKLCEHCGTTEAKRYEWANISGQYKRRRDDFLRLCKKCHNDYDGVNAWQNKALRASVK